MPKSTLYTHHNGRLEWETGMRHAMALQHWPNSAETLDLLTCGNVTIHIQNSGVTNVEANTLTLLSQHHNELKLLQWALFLKIKRWSQRILLDIPETVLFGNTQDPIFPSHSWRLQSKDAKAVTIYITNVYKHFLAHNLFQRAISLFCNEAPNHAEVNCIDQDITQGCIYTRLIHSENQCRK